MSVKCDICQTDYELGDGGRVDVALHTTNAGFNYAVLTQRTCPLCAGKLVAYIYQMKRTALDIKKGETSSGE